MANTDIYDRTVLQHYLDRLDNLRSDSKRGWGTMSPAQMMAHCSNALETTVGDAHYKRGLIGKIFGAIAKKSVLSEKPFKTGLPTDKNFVIKNDRNFEEEKKRLSSLLHRASDMGPQELDKQVHPFFGNLNAAEWSLLTCKHMDHHLRQFGV